MMKFCLSSTNISKHLLLIYVRMSNRILLRSTFEIIKFKRSFNSCLLRSLSTHSQTTKEKYQLASKQEMLEKLNVTIFTQLTRDAPNGTIVNTKCSYAYYNKISQQSRNQGA